MTESPQWPSPAAPQQFTLPESKLGGPNGPCPWAKIYGSPHLRTAPGTEGEITPDLRGCGVDSLQGANLSPAGRMWAAGWLLDGLGVSHMHGASPPSDVHTGPALTGKRYLV